MKQKKSKNKSKSKRKNKLLILFLLIIIILLILLTNLILVARLGNYIPIEKETMFIVTKKPELIINDKDIKWESNSDIKIFSSEFINDKNEIVIKNKEKKNVVGPGAEDSYSFTIKNTGNMAINYKVDLDTKITLNNQALEIESLPIMIRIRKDNNYCLGSEKSWVHIKELDTFFNKGTLGINSYSKYEIDWKWPYENEETIDTKLGIISANSKEPLEFTLKINTHGETNENPKTTGGIKYKDIVETKEIGGTIKIFPFLLLILIIVILILILVYKMKKYNQDNKNKRIRKK